MHVPRVPEILVPRCFTKSCPLSRCSHVLMLTLNSLRTSDSHFFLIHHNVPFAHHMDPFQQAAFFGSLKITQGGGDAQYTTYVVSSSVAPHPLLIPLREANMRFPPVLCSYIVLLLLLLEGCRWRATGICAVRDSPEGFCALAGPCHSAADHD